MTDIKKPEVMRLAVWRERSWEFYDEQHMKAADELRRLHAENEALREALECPRADDTALLRQAFDALNTTDGNDDGKQWYDTKAVKAALFALRERLR